MLNCCTAVATPASVEAFNEPETTLHGDLLPPLARLISAAAADSQNVAISHAQPLVDALRTLPGYLSITLRKGLVRWPTNVALRGCGSWVAPSSLGFAADLDRIPRRRRSGRRFVSNRLACSLFAAHTYWAGGTTCVW